MPGGCVPAGVPVQLLVTNSITATHSTPGQCQRKLELRVGACLVWGGGQYTAGLRCVRVPDTVDKPAKQTSFLPPTAPLNL